MRRLLLIDASSYIHRAFHAAPKMVNNEGFPIGAIQTFTWMMLKVMKPRTFPNFHDHVAVVFEKSAKTFRHKLHAGYKAGRVRHEDLTKQMPTCREIVSTLGITRVEVDGFEADDVIASFCAKCPFDTRITVATPDKDLMQVMRPGFIEVYDPRGGKDNEGAMRTPEEIERVFGAGIKPRQIVDVQALCGDPVDKIPGVAGIGEKTASALVAKFGSLEVVLAAPDGEFPSPRIARLVKAGADSARLSYSLARLSTNVPIPTLEMTKRQDVDAEALVKLLVQLRLQSIARQVARDYRVAL